MSGVKRGRTREDVALLLSEWIVNKVVEYPMVKVSYTKVSNLKKKKKKKNLPYILLLGKKFRIIENWLVCEFCFLKESNQRVSKEKGIYTAAVEDKVK